MTTPDKSRTLRLRTFLLSAFDDEALTHLCYDHFREVHDRFSVGMTRTQKAQELVAHCERRDLLDKLERLVTDAPSPPAPSSSPSTPPPPNDPSPPRQRATILVFITLLVLTITVFALLKGISPDTYAILLLGAGTVMAGISWLLRKKSAGERAKDGDFQEQYLRWLRTDEHSRIITLGPRDVGEPPRVHDVFVDLRISRDADEHQDSPLVTKMSLEEQPIWFFLRHISQQEEDNVALVVLGGAGYGKTVLMQHIALTFAERTHRKRQIRFFLPLLLRLRDHITAMTADRPPMLGALLHDHFRVDSQGGQSLHPSDGWFEEQLRHGALVLLDGLDEVPDRTDRAKVARWIDQQIRVYPRSRFVITSRPSGYYETPLSHPRRSILRMQSFTPDQRREFLEKWFTADFSRFERSAEGRRRAREQARRKAQKVLAEIHSKPTLQELAGNPLLLTMIALAAQDEGKLPSSRLELYKEIYEVLLYRRSSRKGIQELLPSPQKDRVLRLLATHMTHHEVSKITSSEAMDVLKGRIRWKRERGSVLEFMHTTTNLVIPLEKGYWTFAHGTFREYAAAKELFEQSGQGRVPDWAALVGKSWWLEVLRFYVAMADDATPVMQACLKVEGKETIPALVVASHCLDDGIPMEPEVQKQVHTRLRKTLEYPTDWERFREAVDVSLARRRHNLHSIDEQRAIDLTFITHAEYQLFLEEIRQPQKEYLLFLEETCYWEQEYHPDHWRKTPFEAGQGASPVVGIRARDAQTFCVWLTHHQGDNATYRLPTRQEVRDYPPASSEPEEVGTWCQDGEDFELEGLSLQSMEPWRATLKAVQEELIGEMIPLPETSDFTRNLARDLDLAGALVRTPNHEQTLALALDLAHAQPTVLAHHFASILEDALTNNQALANKIEYHSLLPLGRTLELVLDLTRGPAPPSSLAQVFVDTLTFIRSRDSVLPAQHIQVIEGEAFHEARQVLHGEKARDRPEQRRLALLDSLLQGLTAETLATVWHARRWYAALLLAYVWIGYRERDRVETLQPGWIPHRPSAANQEQGKYEEERQTVLNVYWWLVIVLAREAGKLPAWEGLRVVREEPG